MKKQEILVHCLEKFKNIRDHLHEAQVKEWLKAENGCDKFKDFWAD